MLSKFTPGTVCFRRGIDGFEAFSTVIPQCCIDCLSSAGSIPLHRIGYWVVVATRELSISEILSPLLHHRYYPIRHVMRSDVNRKVTMDVEANWPVRGIGHALKILSIIHISLL